MSEIKKLLWVAHEIAHYNLLCILEVWRVLFCDKEENIVSFFIEIVIHDNSCDDVSY